MIQNMSSKTLTFEVLPFRLITKILNRYYVLRPSNFLLQSEDPNAKKQSKVKKKKPSIFYIWRDISLFDFFGYFRADRFRKIFTLFTSCLPECEIYGSISRKIPFHRIYHYGEVLLPRYRYPPVPASLSRRITDRELFSMLSQSVFLKSLEKRCLTNVPKGLVELKHLKIVKLLISNSLGRFGEKRYREAITILNSLTKLKTLYIHIVPDNHLNAHLHPIPKQIDQKEEQPNVQITRNKKKQREPLEFLPRLGTLCLLGGFFCPNILFSKNVRENLKRCILKETILNQSIINELSQNFPKLNWLELELFHLPPFSSSDSSSSSSSSDTNNCDICLFDISPIFFIKTLRFLFLSTSETESLIRIWNNLRLSSSTNRKCQIDVISLKVTKHPMSELVDPLVPLITPDRKFLYVSSSSGHFVLKRRGCELQFKKDRLLRKIVVIPLLEDTSNMMKNVETRAVKSFDYSFSCNGDYFPRSIVEEMLKYESIFRFDSFELMDQRLPSIHDIRVLCRLPVRSLSLFECHFNEIFLQELSNFCPVLEKLEIDRCAFPPPNEIPYSSYDGMIGTGPFFPRLQSIRISMNHYRIGEGYVGCALIPKLKPEVSVSIDFLNFTISPSKLDEDEEVQFRYDISLSNYSSSMPVEELEMIHSLFHLCSTTPFISKKIRSMTLNRCSVEEPLLFHISRLTFLQKLSFTECSSLVPINLSTFCNLQEFAYIGGQVMSLEETFPGFCALESLKVLKIVQFKIHGRKSWKNLVLKYAEEVLKEGSEIELDEFHFVSPSKEMVKLFEKKKTVLVVLKKGYLREQRFKGGERVK